MVQQRPALRHQLQKTTTGVVVLLVVLEVFGQVVDALRKDCNLNFGGTGVAFGGRVFLDKSCLALCSDLHRTILSMEEE